MCVLFLFACFHSRATPQQRSPTHPPTDQREKNAREKAEEDRKAEKERLAQAKFHQQSTSLQKMQDDEGAILEKRNRRYQDAMERQERDKESKREERRQQTLREMQEARETQKAIKQQAKEMEAQIQKREFYRILRDNKQADARKAVIEEKKAMLRKQHQEELMHQIHEAVGFG